MLKKIKKVFTKSKPIVAHLSLEGVIGKGGRFEKGLNYETCFPLIEKAFKVDNVKTVAISINSPGGSPVQSELIFNAIRQLSKEKKVPVYTFAQDVAASGGYWLLLAGDKIYTHNSSIIGSIGVIFSGFGLVKAIEKLGVERRVYTEGKNKAVMDPFMPEKEENIKILKSVQHDIFENFKDLVKSRRKNHFKNDKGKKIKEDDKFLEDSVFTGAFWSGKSAKELGLVDDIADMRAEMIKKFGKKVKIIEITNKKSLLKSIFSSKQDRIVSSLISQIEERAVFSKFGL